MLFCFATFVAVTFSQVNASPRVVKRWLLLSLNFWCIGAAIGMRASAAVRSGKCCSAGWPCVFLYFEHFSPLFCLPAILTNFLVEVVERDMVGSTLKKLLVTFTAVLLFSTMYLVYNDHSVLFLPLYVVVFAFNVTAALLSARRHISHLDNERVGVPLVRQVWPFYCTVWFTILCR